MTRLALGVLLAAALSVAALAQQEPTADELQQTVDGTVDIEQRTQQANDDWAVEKAALMARYRTAQAQVEFLGGRRDVEQTKADALAARVTELRRRLSESARLQESIEDTLTVLIGRLENWVAVDLPFLPEERRARLDNLRNEMARPDVTAAEKLRRVLEALQIEAAYGGMVEVNRQQIDIDGQELHVDVLQLGRLSLFWRTPDGQRRGKFDPAAGKWIELGADSDRNIFRAIEMATRRRPAGLVSLPVGRIATEGGEQ